jgi:hypothetical protein
MLRYPDRYVRLSKQPLRAPIERILTEHSIKLIKEGYLGDLPSLFHNLCTDTTQQKMALEKDRTILLTHYEAFTIYFVRSITTLGEPVQPFFNHDLMNNTLRDQDGGAAGYGGRLKYFIQSKLNDSILSFFKPTEGRNIAGNY